ncbi:hypothetical protein SAMN06295912_10536 [Sphingomonas laterariae]|uniref:Uncharacterized protein n=1 Tax=Edaphosphingomonas laterariae TaxID=861865 RepID=A0A239DUS2_9SPHN|nr:hypothetical protein [Sphingomonas laterariae]SNS35698.1 hypothetical protein SAMN06295912_10536 [Sphingomonas laterariae]
MTRLTADFCERRALEEMEAAERAACPEAKAAHRQLAREFSSKAKALRTQGDEPRLRGPSAMLMPRAFYQ